MLVARRKYGSELLAIHAERMGATAYAPGTVRKSEPYAANLFVVPASQIFRVSKVMGVQKEGQGGRGIKERAYGDITRSLPLPGQRSTRSGWYGSGTCLRSRLI